MYAKHYFISEFANIFIKIYLYNNGKSQQITYTQNLEK